MELEWACLYVTNGHEEINYCGDFIHSDDGERVKPDKLRTNGLLRQ